MTVAQVIVGLMAIYVIGFWTVFLVKRRRNKQTRNYFFCTCGHEMDKHELEPYRSPCDDCDCENYSPSGRIGKKVEP